MSAAPKQGDRVRVTQGPYKDKVGTVLEVQCLGGERAARVDLGNVSPLIYAFAIRVLP